MLLQSKQVILNFEIIFFPQEKFGKLSNKTIALWSQVSYFEWIPIV